MNKRKLNRIFVFLIFILLLDLPFSLALSFSDIIEGGNDRFTYNSKEEDSTELFYYGARYYKADTLKRFIQPDSLISDIYNPQSLNRYSYVLNNPYKYVDKEGNFAVAFDVGPSGGAIVYGSAVGGYVITFNPGSGLLQLGAYSTVGTGFISGASASASLQGSFSPFVNSVEEFSGKSTDFSLTVGEGGRVGGGLGFSDNSKNTFEKYLPSTYTTSASLAGQVPPLTLTGAASETQTKTLYSKNIYDPIRKLFKGENLLSQQQLQVSQNQNTQREGRISSGGGSSSSSGSSSGMYFNWNSKKWESQSGGGCTSYASCFQQEHKKSGGKKL